MSRKLTKWLLFRRLAIPVAMLLGIAMIGTVGYMTIEGYSLLDALYMTAITVSTTGFREIKELSEGGKVFTMLMIAASLATVAFYATMITRLLLDGQWREQYRQYRFGKKLALMENHVIICGYGRNGRQACAILRQNGIRYTVIEQRSAFVHEAQLTSDLVVPGDATRDEVLTEAGIARAKALITALPSDADNLFVVLTARQLNPKLTIISRASDDHSVGKLKIAGATNVIMPDKLGGANLAALVMKPDVHEFLSMLTTEHNEQFMVTELKAGRLLVLEDANIWHRTGCTVIGIKLADGSYIRNPGPTQQVQQGEGLILMGTAKDIVAARKLVG